jgi:hypothetical protein
MQTVPGMRVPDELIRRLEGAEDKKAEGVKITVAMIQAIKEITGVAGGHIMAIAWESIVPEIVEKAGLLPRPRVGQEKPSEQQGLAGERGRPCGFPRFRFAPRTPASRWQAPQRQDVPSRGLASGAEHGDRPLRSC